MNVVLAEEDTGKAVINITRPDEGYSAVLYDNSNGLPTSEANAIVQTDDGFLWIGSYSGLYRYDGNTFERWDSTGGIASVKTLFVDSKNRLWVGTNDSGVAVIEKGEVRMFRLKDGLQSLSVRAIAEDKRGYIYVGTTQGIVEINESMVVRSLDQDDIRDAEMRDLKLGPDGIIYCLTKDEKLFTIKDGARQHTYDLNNKGLEDVKSIYPDPDKEGYLYLGAKNGQVYYGDVASSLMKFDTIDVSPLSEINSILKIDDVLWLCADNGIGYCYDGSLIYLGDGVPMTNSVDHIVSDYQGNLWFTSSRRGVMKLVRNRFVNISAWCGMTEEKEDMVVNTTCAIDNLLLLGTDSGLRVIDNMETTDYLEIKSIRTASGTPITVDTDNLCVLFRKKTKEEDGKEQNAVRIRSIIKDSQDRLWFSTWNEYGLLRYDHGDIVVYPFEDSKHVTAFEGSEENSGTGLMLPSGQVRVVRECHDGKFLVAWSGGVAVIDGDRVERVITKEDGLHNTEILTVEEAPNGDYVIGTDGGGIYVISNGVMYNYTTESGGLSSDIIMRIRWDDRNKVFWIVTSNSIAYMTENYIRRTIQNFPYSNNFDILINSQNEMWILSSNGIYVTTAEEMLANGEIKPLSYNKGNGLPYVATSNSYSALTENGDLYIAGNLGVARVNIEEPYDVVSSLKMGVPYLVADGKAIYPNEDGSFSVPSNTKRLAIHSFVFTYSLTNPTVTYWLDGFDHSKTTVIRSNLSPVNYTNLSGGTYYFRMRVQDSFGDGVKEFSVRIVKRKAFYETWWFMLFAVIALTMLVCMLVVQYVKRKTQKLIAKEEEQKTFIREMIEAFAKTIDMKDRYTNGHSTRVAEYTVMLAKELGFDEEEVEKYHNIALLHDIGKIGIPAAVLNKQGQLTDDEFKIIKSHASLGARVLKDISIMPELSIGAAAHHERPDGKGYPNGLKGDEIPRVAQIIAVADTFDAMYSDRPYRKRMNFEKVVGIIRDAAGTQLAADVVDAFLRLVDKGFFRAPDDEGGGSTEDIDNIHKSFQRAQKIKEEAAANIAQPDASGAGAEEKKPEEAKQEEPAGKPAEAAGQPAEEAQTAETAEKRQKGRRRKR